MITFIEGVLEEKTPTRIVLNLHGVGYEVSVPLSTYDRLPAPGEFCRILTIDHVREDSHSLFGFAAEEDRQLFIRLLGISGIGPKIALSALSSLSARSFKAAVVEGDVKRLSSISGIGKRTAERIVVELRDKFSAGEALAATAGETEDEQLDVRTRDAIMALISLGYKQNDAWKMIKRILPKSVNTTSVEELVRHALTE